MDSVLELQQASDPLDLLQPDQAPEAAVVEEDIGLAPLPAELQYVPGGPYMYPIQYVVLDLAAAAGYWRSGILSETERPTKPDQGLIVSSCWASVPLDCRLHELRAFGPNPSSVHYSHAFQHKFVVREALRQVKCLRHHRAQRLPVLHATDGQISVVRVTKIEENKQARDRHVLGLLTSLRAVFPGDVTEKIARKILPYAKYDVVLDELQLKQPTKEKRKALCKKERVHFDKKGTSYRKHQASYHRR